VGNAKTLESIGFEDEFWRMNALRFFHPDFNRWSGIFTLSAKVARGLVSV